MNNIDHIHRGFRRRELFQWGVAETATDAVLGTCTLTHYSLTLTSDRRHVGFALRQGAMGQGLGTEAVTAVIGFAFDSLNLNRIEADVDPRNERSLRLLERLGFQREGYLRQRYYVNGERQDTLMLGLLRSDLEWLGGPAKGAPTPLGYIRSRARTPTYGPRGQT